MPASKIKDELLDALLDLKHDLGKYLLQPLGMLPDHADSDQLRSALRTALLATRKEGTEEIAASALWCEFTAQWKSVLSPFHSFLSLQDAVTRALELASLVECEGTDIERESVQTTLAGVGEAIQSVIEEVESDA